MVRIYLDLETYRPYKKDAFVNERIISCGLLLDNTSYCEDSLKEEDAPELFSEWDGLDEQALVKRVHDRVDEVKGTHEITIICGFNILRFDIPLLICKAIQYSLGRPEDLTKMWDDCFIIDYFQQLIVVNGNRFKGLSLKNIVDVAKRHELNPPEYTMTGEAIKELYDKKDFKEIERHLEQDLRIVRWLDLYGARRLIEVGIREGKALFSNSLN